MLLWRAGLRISEALALQEGDLDRSRGALLVRRAKGGKRREVGMHRWAWEQLDPWLEIRRQLPIGALLCVIHGPTAGRRWEASAARKQLHHAAAEAGVRRRFAPRQLRHAHAVEMAHEGVPLVPFSALAEGMVFLFGPGWLDVEQFEDLALGVGEAVEADAVGGVGDA